MKTFRFGAIVASVAGVLAARVSAGVLPNTTANGVVYMTYDRAAWAVVAPSAGFYDIHGNPTGKSGTASDTDGYRWMFPDRFEGAGWVAATYPADYLTPLPDHPLVQPSGGFVLPVNTPGTNAFAANHKITSYNSTSAPNGFIGLAGSFRATSDFNEPGASVWWEHLALALDPADSIWKLQATSGPGQGSLFELRNIFAETVGGNLHLSADYVFGNTDWLQFFQDVNGHVDTNAVLGHIELIPADVARIVAGSARIDYRESAIKALASGLAKPPVLTLTAFFDQSRANALDQDHLLSEPQTGASYTGQVYVVNGGSVTNLASRYTQPTTFLYPKGNPMQHVGRIGLGGVARFSALGGGLLFGDYTLQYDVARVAVGGSGWFLQGNIPPVAPVFDLVNVTVTETENSLAVAGDLGVSFEVANFLFGTAGDTLANVGTFSFTGYTVPLTTPEIHLAADGGNIVLQVTNGLPGSGFTVRSTTNLALPPAAWVIVATGNFAADGSTTNSIPIAAADGARYFRLQQP